MSVSTAVRALTLTEANEYVAAGASYVDLRPLDDYLDVHIPGSIGLEYERGPGLAGRARDCLPLDVPLVLLDSEGAASDGPGTRGGINAPAAAASLRGKGFTVIGTLADGLRTWSQTVGSPASTERSNDAVAPSGTVLQVGEAGAPSSESGLLIPIEQLADRVEEVPTHTTVVIAAGRGLRAVLAVGMLERAGCTDLIFWSSASPRATFGKSGVVTLEPPKA